MFPILIRLGPITLHTYGLLVALGIFAGIKICIRAASKDGFSGKEVQDSIYQLGFYVMLSGILGARVFYVVTHWAEFSANITDVIKIWQGGLVFYGGLIGALVGFYVWNRSKPFAADWKQVTDWIAPSLAFGHALGRLGCFAAGCCYGKVTDEPWGVTFLNPDSLAPLGIPLHPTQIYESIFLILLGCFLLRRLSKTHQDPNRKRGAIFIEYLLIYSVGRFLIEFLRADEPLQGGLSPGQMVSLVIFASALAFAIKRKNVR